MTMLDTESVPRRGWHVRRRKYEGAAWLVARNRFFRLDPAADAVWMAADGTRPVAEIARHVSAALDRPLDEALAAVVLALVCFREQGLVELHAPPPP
jgi:hypothetical protein